ncbi:17426_t:CDS:1 [Cetraspora pellucida]|uniref:17426_t:CDS:1 n=1 Tax=Cetraspora pellucida TaxID=1433469 RepID=A0A9N9E0B4_9GLOM|nr:17426_t:CDS:1 [Cetraspora pellucida]
MNMKKRQSTLPFIVTKVPLIKRASPDIIPIIKKSDIPTEVPVAKKRTFPLANSFASPLNSFSLANNFDSINGFGGIGLLPLAGGFGGFGGFGAPPLTGLGGLNPIGIAI